MKILLKKKRHLTLDEWMFDLSRLFMALTFAHGAIGSSSQENYAFESPPPPKCHKGSTSNRFSRKPQTRTSSQTKSQKGDDKREGSGTLVSNEYARHNVKAIKLNADTDEETTVEINQATTAEKGPGMDDIVEKVKQLSHVGRLTISTEKGRISTVDERSNESANAKQTAKSVVSASATERAYIDDDVKRNMGKLESAEGRKDLGSEGRKEDDYSLQAKMEMEVKSREHALQKLSGGIALIVLHEHWYLVKKEVLSP
ncbi:hypothetical protein ACET3Z_030845 [Daucus carota]